MYRTFSKLAVAVIVAGFTMGAAHTASAQDGAKDDIIRPLTKAGSAAFMFTLNGLGNFGIAAPSAGLVPGVGVKYFVSDDLALRILLGLQSRSSGSDSTNQTVVWAGNSPESLRGKLSETDFSLGVGAEMHFRPLYSTSPYVGAQILFSSLSGTVTQWAVGDPTKKDFDTKKSVSQFGISVIAGFDWFFTRGLALGAEVGLGFTTSSSSLEGPDGTGKTITSDDPSSTVIALATQAAVHFLAYF